MHPVPPFHLGSSRMSSGSASAPIGQGGLALAVTLSIQMLAASAVLTGPVLAPLAAADVGVEPHFIGIYVATAYAFAAGGGLLSGGFMARFGPLRVSQMGLVLCAVGLLLAVLATPAAVLASAAVVGAGYGPITPTSSQILIRTTAPARLNLVFSIKQTGVPLGGALAGAVLPTLAEVTGWRGAVIVTAICCLAVAAAAEPFRRSFAIDFEHRGHRPFFSFTQIAGPLKLVLRSPELRVLAFTSFAYAGMQVSLSSFLITYLNSRLEMSVQLAGVVLAFALGAGVGGRILWGFVADRFIAPMRLLGILGLTMSFCAVAVGFFDVSWPFVAIILVSSAYGGTAIAWNGVQLAQVARYAPAGRAGEITGSTSFITFGGVMVVPFLFSMILDTIGSYMVAYSAAAVLTLISGFAFLRGIKRG